MSTLVLAQPHLRALTNFAFAYGVEEIDCFFAACHPEEFYRDAFGRLLLEENVRSVRTRYEPSTADALVGPEPLAFEAGAPDVALHDSLTVLQACSCYDYQACEVENYRSTWASEAIDRIRRAACSALLQDVRLPDRMSGWPIQTDEPAPAYGLPPRYHPRRGRLAALKEGERAGPGRTSPRRPSCPKILTTPPPPRRTRSWDQRSPLLSPVRRRCADSSPSAVSRW